MNLALLLSGGGTTAARIISECRAGKTLEGMTPVLVISSDPEAGGIKKAKALGIAPEDVIVIERKDFDTPEAFGEAIIAECSKREVDIIGQYGWMVKTPANVIAKYEGKMINQHPGPLDIGHQDFGGAGMYGMRVHSARLCFVNKTQHNYWSEATAQRVAAEFDTGVVIKSKRVPIHIDDTPEMLQERMLPVEHEVQVLALEDFLNNDVTEVTRSERLVGEHDLNILNECKQEAILKYPKG